MTFKILIVKMNVCVCQIRVWCMQYEWNWIKLTTICKFNNGGGNNVQKSYSIQVGRYAQVDLVRYILYRMHMVKEL